MKLKVFRQETLHFIREVLPNEIGSLSRQVQKKSRQLFETEESVLRKGITANHRQYIGLYEAIYQVSVGNFKNRNSTFGEWRLRTENLSEESRFKTLSAARFSQYAGWTDAECQKNAKLILSGLYKAGIVRDGRAEIEADQWTENRYNTLDGRTLQPGERAQVLRGCWLSNDDTVLEHGTLK